MTKPRLNPRVIVLVLVAVACAALLANWLQGRAAANAPPQGSGTVEAIEIEVAPQVAGRIAALLVNDGDTVRAGQVIARLDDEEPRAQLRQALGQRDAALNTLRNLQEGSRTQQIAAARATLAAALATADGADRTLRNAEMGFSHATDTKQAVDAARAQLRALAAQYLVAKRQAAAVSAQASGASKTLATAETGLRSVTELRQQRDAAQGQLDTARAVRERALSALSIARADFDRASAIYNQGAISKRDFDNARLALDTAKTGLDSAEAQTVAAQAAVRNADRALQERLQARQNVIAAQTSHSATSEQREAALAQVRQAAALLAGARLSLANAETAYRDRLQPRTALDSARAASRAAHAQAEAARQNLALLVAGNTPATLRAAKGQLEAAEGALAVARHRLRETVVRAPQSGSVSTVVAHAGETVSAGLPVVKMLDLPHAFVRVYLAFQAFGKVKIGDRAKVETDALPGRTFEGKVTEVATEAEFTPKNVETRNQRLQQVYWVKVSLRNADGRLKPGMPATATILIH